MKPAFALAALLLVSTSATAQEATRTQINSILDEGLNRSEVMETAAYLTDRIGGRLTNSPQMRAAEAWTQQRFRAMGLSNVRAEAFEFGRGWASVGSGGRAGAARERRRAAVAGAGALAAARGWSIAGSGARMTAPRERKLTVIPVAWTPGTNGPISAGIV